MRARHHNGRHRVNVKVPSWVTFRPVALGSLDCVCDHCKTVVHVENDRHTAEAAMGQFALWHTRCPDPKARRQPRLIVAVDEPPLTYIASSAPKND